LLPSWLLAISFIISAPVASAALPIDFAPDIKTGLTVLKRLDKQLPNPLPCCTYVQTAYVIAETTSTLVDIVSC
jgi:hypothetical protein